MTMSMRMTIALGMTMAIQLALQHGVELSTDLLFLLGGLHDLPPPVLAGCLKP